MLLRTPRSDDPVSGEKLLRFRKYAVSDRFSVLSGPGELGVAGPSQTLSRNEYTGIFQFFAECAHETHIRLKILLRPPRISLEVGLLAGHHQNVFHISSPIEFEVLLAPSHLVGTKLAFSKSVYWDLSPWIANCRTSIGMFVGLPSDPGAAEICPAMAKARSASATSTIQ